MKRLLLTAAALAAVAVPSLGAAQPRPGNWNPDFRQNRGEVRESGRDVRQAQREVRQGEREVRQERQEALRDGRVDRGDRREIEDARRDLRDDRRDLREAQRDFRDDRRDFRNDRWDNRPDNRSDSNRWDNRRWDRADRSRWQGRPEFRGYTGRRSGYWFTPGYGYVRPDARYLGRTWRRGDFVPAAYRGYYVADPYFYGLPYPPPGHRWVYLGNDIVLMSMSSGLIADVMFDVF